MSLASHGVRMPARAAWSITSDAATTVPSIDTGSSHAASGVCPCVTARCSMWTNDTTAAIPATSRTAAPVIRRTVRSLVMVGPQSRCQCFVLVSPCQPPLAGGAQVGRAVVAVATVRGSVPLVLGGHVQGVKHNGQLGGLDGHACDAPRPANESAHNGDRGGLSDIR